MSGSPETTVDGSAADLTGLVGGREWYHTLQLPSGVVTPGWFDCRKVARWILPASCEGMRCLDIGTFDGFWAFEMERRGAAEVVAVDILDESRWDWPVATEDGARRAIAQRKGAGDGFLIARDRLGSGVGRLDASVYDLDPAQLGQFDLVYLGSLLLHLRDPVRALERVRSVCRGRLVAVDAVSLPLSLIRAPVANLDGEGRPYWWKPNARAFKQMVAVAGFRVLSGPRLFRMPPGRGFANPPLRPGTVRSRRGRELLLASRVGDPHARILAEPVGER